MSPSAISNLLDHLPDSDLCGALVTAFRIMDMDTRMAVAKCRQIVELTIQAIYRERVGPPGSKPLVNMVDELHRAGVIPPDVFTHLYNVRKQGNLSVHGDRLFTVETVLLVLGATVRIVTWSVLNRRGVEATSTE